MVASAASFFRRLLEKIDVRTDGARPHDMAIHDERLFHRVLSQGSLGLGEGYMDGWWDCEDLEELFCRILRARLDAVRNWEGVIPMIKAKLFNLQNRRRSMEVIEKHYDLGNDLYERMLDRRMVYTCGYWEHASNLDEAQEAKLDLICRKVGLQPGQRVLDIGCGFGSFAKFAAERHGAEVVGITLSSEQATYAVDSCKGLPVDIRMQDYRDLRGEQFDHIVSIGMFEAVGYKNFREYMQIVHDCLKDGGLFLLHTIGRNTSATHADPWISKYIFPNGVLPSAAQIGRAIEDLFVMEDWHNFGASYVQTLRAWHENFERSFQEIKGRYGERFRRMWRYYLLSCAGCFRAREAQLWQVVLSKSGVLGGYSSVR